MLSGPCRPVECAWAARHRWASHLGFSWAAACFVSSATTVRCELRQSQLLRTCSKTWEKMPFSEHRALLALPAHDVGAVHDGYVAHEAHTHYFLLQRVGPCVFDEEVGDLLVAGGHISAGGDADELRCEDQFQRILIALGYGVGPAVFHLLHLAKCGRRSICFWLLLAALRRSLRATDMQRAMSRDLVRRPIRLNHTVCPDFYLDSLRPVAAGCALN